MPPKVLVFQQSFLFGEYKHLSLVSSCRGMKSKGISVVNCFESPEVSDLCLSAGFSYWWVSPVWELEFLAALQGCTWKSERVPWVMSLLQKRNKPSLENTSTLQTCRLCETVILLTITSAVTYRSRKTNGTQKGYVICCRPRRDSTHVRLLISFTHGCSNILL